MIKDFKELYIPEYASLTHAEVKKDDMGEKTITTQVKIDGDITPDFSQDWELEFHGDKYIMPLRLPQGAKENTSLNSTIDLTFQHWAIYQLKRWMFFTVQPIDTGTAVADKYIADVIINLGDLCNLFGQVLRHYYGDTITIDLNPNWDYKQEAVSVSINHSYIWDVLIKFHELFAVRWSIEPDGDSSHYVIKVGYPAEELDHIFEYGFDGGLLKVERQVQSEDIRNMILGRGGEKNIPKYYFKKSPDEEKWRSDPDWIEELSNIYFTNLMGATFRSYIQGWKAAHISKYPGYAAVGESNAYAPWAYRKGYTDSKFDPIEYVKDDESIAKYGPLLGGLDNNEEIYPSIQGSGMDIAVDVEQILSDDVEDSVENDAVLSTLMPIEDTAKNVSKGEYKTITVNGGYFYVPKGKHANLYVSLKIVKVRDIKGELLDPDTTASIHGNPTINVYESITGEKIPASGIPEGNWRYEVVVELENITDDKTIDITVEDAVPKLNDATIVGDKWKNTFDIWVKNIWNTQKGIDEDGKSIKETNEQYAERVWKPILGDREGGEAAVMFTTGALAISEDYEFKIPKGAWPVYDTSKSLNGESSHWRIKLAKSDADIESTGLYVPSTQRQGKAGDKIIFIGTEMTHNYVVWAETALDDWKKDQLREKKDIKPTWVVTTDRVRLNNEGNPDALIGRLKAGCSIRLADKRFIDGDYETLYLQSITYTYREPSNDDSALNPDVSIVLSNEYETVANPVATIQGEISALQRQIGSISNVEQIVRAVGDKLYLRKDGISDRSLSPTQFFSLLTSGDFRSGIIGGAGWGFFKDENGNWVLEADRVNVRQEMQVNTLVINQAEGRGGMEIDTAAFMEVTHVVETTNGYVCYFDQKEGTVANLFKVDDVAYCNRWTPENKELKFYKRRVISVESNSITLTKERKGEERPEGWPDSGVNGTGTPSEKDNIIHFGNYTDKTRQYVKVRDVVGGGYERYIEELNSVNAAGVEYYFVGKQSGKSRWFVGNKDLVPYSGKGDGSYIEFKDRKFNLHNVTLSIGSSVGDKNIGDYIDDKAQEAADSAKNELQEKIDILQNQVDGVVESFNGFGAPTVNNYPANEWDTDEEKKRHDRDIYTDITEYVDDVTTPTAGQSWKWYYNSPADYGWVKIADSDAIKALQLAAMSIRDADVMYISHTSPTSSPSLPSVNTDGLIIDLKGWQTTAPEWVPNRYIWQTTYVRKGNGSAYFSDPTCIQGIKGETGNGISNLDEYYALNDSVSTPPTSWIKNPETTPVPTATNRFLWNYEEITYTSGEVSEIPPRIICMYSEDGKSLSVKSTLSQWKSDPQGVNPPLSGWQNSIPEVPQGHYLWCKSTVTYTDGEKDYPSVTYSSSRQGADGSNGENYSNNMLETSQDMGAYFKHNYAGPWVDTGEKIEGCSIFKRDVNSRRPFCGFYYDHEILIEEDCTLSVWARIEKGTAYGASWTVEPLSRQFSPNVNTQWRRIRMDVPKGSVLKNGSHGMIEMIAFSDYQDNTVYLAGFKLERGIVQDTVWSPAASETVAPTIVSTETKYVKGTNITSQPTDAQFDASTLTAPGTVSKNQWLWSRTKIIWSDGQTSKTYSSSYIGNDGTNGTPGANGYTHIAYCSGISGTLPNPVSVTGFNTTAFAGAKYIGFCTDHTEADPTDFKKYEWSEYKGEDGDDGRSLVNTTDYYLATNNGTTAPTSGWKTDFTQAGYSETNRYLWNYEISTYTKAPLSVASKPRVISVWGEKGEQGIPAKVVTVNADSTVFTYDNNFTTLVGPAKITLSATLQGTSGYQWSYKAKGATGFTNFIKGNNGTSQSIEILPNESALFPNDANSLLIRCSSGGVYDEVTIYKVSSGGKGDSYTENIALKSGVQKTTSEYFINSYRISEKLVIGEVYTFTIWGKLGTGKSFGIFDSAGSTAIAFSVPKIAEGVYQIQTAFRKSTNAVSNIINIYNYPSNVNSESTIYKVKVEKGRNPNPVWNPNSSEMEAVTVLLTNESHIFEGNSASSTECGVVAYKGSTPVSVEIGTISGQVSGMTTAISNNNTTSAKFTVNVTKAITQKQGTLNVPVTVDGKTFTKKFSWSLSYSARNIYARGTQSNRNSPRILKVDGNEIALTNGRGLQLTTLNRQTLSVAFNQIYDVSGSVQAQTDLVTKLNSLDDSVFVILTSYDSISMSESMNTALNNFGGIFSDVFSQKRRAFAFIGYKGLQKGYAQWIIDTVDGTGTSSFADVSVYVSEGMFTTSKTQTGVKSITEQYYLSTSRTQLQGGSWSDQRQPWVAGRFYWTRSKITYNDGTVEYAGEICVTGESAYRLALSVTTSGIQCNSSGSVTGTYPTSQATVYRGGARVTSGITYSIPQKSGISTASINSSGLLTMTGITADRAEITVQAVVEGVTLADVFTLNKVKDGQSGPSGPAAVSYDIVPSINSIVRYMTGELSISTLFCTVYKVTGNSAAVKSNDHTLRYKRLPSNASGTLIRTNGVSSSLYVNDGDESIVFELVNSSNLVIKSVSIPILTDASDIGVSSRNLLIGSEEFTVTNNDTNFRYSYFELPIPLEAGDYVALMVEDITNMAGSASEYTVAIYNKDINEELTSSTKRITQSDRTAVFKITKSASVVRVLFYAGVAGATSGNTVKYRRAILVKGNIPMESWTPSPEDIKHEIEGFDYISRALKESTEIKNGLVCTSLIEVGETNENGVRESNAGMNGIIGEGEKSIAFWAGRPKSNPRFVIRMDGTGHASGGTIKFEENKIVVGENIILNDDGMILNDENGEERLRISNTSVGNLFGATSSKIPIDRSGVRIRKTMDLWEYLEIKDDYPILGPIDPINPTYPSLRPPVDGLVKPNVIQYYFLKGAFEDLRTLPKVPGNSTLEVVLDLYFNETYTVRASVGLSVYYIENEQNISVYENDYIAFGKEQNSTRHYINYKTNILLKKETSYYVKIYMKDQYDTTQSQYYKKIKSSYIYTTISGAAEFARKKRTILGSDGLLSVWKNSSFLVSGSLFCAIVGNNGLRITASGIESTKDGLTWKPLSI